MTRTTILNVTIAVAIVLGGLLLSAVLAQTGGYSLTAGSISSGGSRTGGVYRVDDAIGQPAVARLSGGGYILESGIWDSETAVQHGGKAYLPLIERPLPTPTPSPTPTPTPSPTPSPTVPPCDESEPANNVPKSAPLLTTIGRPCSGSFDNASGDKTDLYKIQLDTQTTITIDLANIPDQGDDTLALYDAPFGHDSKRPPICVSKVPGQANEHIVYPNAAPGTYYIGVFLVYRSAVAPDSYQLRVSSDNQPASCVPPS